MKKISVIIPVYNCEKTIEKTLNSILQQEYKNYEVIIVNDGSKDKSVTIISNYMKKHIMNIKLINIDNGGVSNARNVAINNATGDIIVFLDGDDYILKGYFQNIIENIRDYDIIVYGYISSYHDIEKIKRLHLKNMNRNNTKVKFYESLDKRKLANLLTNKVYNSKIAKEISFNTKLDIGEDLDFFIQALIKSNKYKYIDKVYYKYILSNNGLGFKNRETILNEKKTMYKNLIKMYQNESNDMKYINNLIAKAYIQEFSLIYKNRLPLSKIKIHMKEYNSSIYKRPLGFRYYIAMKLFSLNNLHIQKIMCKIIIYIDKKCKYKEYKIGDKK